MQDEQTWDHTKRQKEQLEQARKMQQYTTETKVESTLRTLPQEPKKNSIFGKVS